MGLRLFISYAHVDIGQVKQIVDILNDLDYLTWFDRRLTPGKDWRSQLQEAISACDAFLYVISPESLASEWCQWEFAQAVEKGIPIMPALIRETSNLPECIKKIQWVDFTQGITVTSVSKLVNGLQHIPPSEIPTTPHNPSGEPTHAKDNIMFLDTDSQPGFQNREEELDTIVDSNLMIYGGERFFLINAGPQMGKSWLTHKVENKLLLTEKWVIKKVDLRTETDARIDVNRLISLYFNERESNGITDKLLQKCAIDISKSNKSLLCVLDSAELLEEKTEELLRSYLSEIYHYLSSTGREDITFGFIAASRRIHPHWKGLPLTPRFKIVSLTHFKLPVVKKSLRDMAATQKRNLSNDWYETNAQLLYDETEGLPALLTKYMTEIRENDYIAPQTILEFETFEKLAVPYVEHVLLSAKNLIPSGGEGIEHKRKVLRELLMYLSSFRIFSPPHIKYILENGANIPALQSILGELNWSEYDLWSNLKRTYLTEPVPQIYPSRIYVPIRRLLFRYNFRSQEAQINIHHQASEFYKDWWSHETSEDIIVYLFVEYLWHYSEYLRLSANPDLVSNYLIKAKSEFDAILAYTRLPRNYLLERLEERIFSDPSAGDEGEFVRTTFKIKPNLLIEMKEYLKEG
ncbi:MAG: toll/interleukin-1 receptor domain-containing protein [Anaerolineae bacterium]|nr:toll/interleukin-1 receptor domain-containing protein [Anaerolineae bacterium]